MNSPAEAARSRKRGPTVSDQLAELQRVEVQRASTKRARRSRETTGGAVAGESGKADESGKAAPGAPKVAKAAGVRDPVSPWLPGKRLVADDGALDKWRSKYLPKCREAEAEWVHEAMEGMFERIWASIGPAAAKEAIEPLLRRVRESRKVKANAERPSFGGAWRLTKAGQDVGRFEVGAAGEPSVLTHEDLQGECRAEPKALDSSDWCDLGATHKFRGEISHWGNVDGDFKVTLRVTLDSGAGSIKGEVSVRRRANPSRRVDFGLEDDVGGSFDFEGERA